MADWLDTTYKITESIFGVAERLVDTLERCRLEGIASIVVAFLLWLRLKRNEFLARRAPIRYWHLTIENALIRSFFE